VWPAAHLLCAYLLREQRAALRNARVLELGAGVGLCGLVAAQFCNIPVLLTDGSAEVVSLLHRNVERNSTRCTARAALFDFSQPDRLQALLTQESARFDLILGSDIVFWQQSVPALFCAVARLLSENGVFALSYQSRASAADRLLEQSAAAAALSWRALEPRQVLTAAHEHLRLLLFTHATAGQH